MEKVIQQKINPPLYCAAPASIYGILTTNKKATGEV